MWQPWVGLRQQRALRTVTQSPVAFLAQAYWYFSGCLSCPLGQLQLSLPHVPKTHSLLYLVSLSFLPASLLVRELPEAMNCARVISEASVPGWDHPAQHNSARLPPQPRGPSILCFLGSLPPRDLISSKSHLSSSPMSVESCSLKDLSSPNSQCL